MPMFCFLRSTFDIISDDIWYWHLDSGSVVGSWIWHWLRDCPLALALTLVLALALTLALGCVPVLATGIEFFSSLTTLLWLCWYCRRPTSTSLRWVLARTLTSVSAPWPTSLTERFNTEIPPEQMCRCCLVRYEYNSTQCNSVNTYQCQLSWCQNANAKAHANANPNKCKCLLQMQMQMKMQMLNANA